MMGRARPPGCLTVKEMVRRLVYRRPGITAVEAGKVLEENIGTASWGLIQLVKAGELKRKHGCGPRGGWGYFPK